MKQFETPTPKITYLDRALGVISPRLAAQRVSSRFALHQFAYDAARMTTQRATAPQNINPNDYSKQRDRLQLMREATDLENNFAPAKVINRKYSMYVAPTSYHAMTGDAKLDKDVESWLNSVWFPHCDITNRYDFFRMMEFGVMGMNRGGDYGWAFMRPGYDERMDAETVSQLPFRIQAVEPDRIGGLYQNVVQADYVGGVVIGRYGEPTHYRVFRRGLTVQQYTDPIDVPVHNFVHYTDPMQADMYRGVSKLDTGAIPLRDFYEISGFIQGKAKLASALTLFTGSAGGQIPAAGGGAMDAYQSSFVPGGQAVLQQDIQYGQINHLLSGQDIKFPDTSSPGPETQYLMKMLLEFVAMSYNLPHSFALDASALGGVSARLESEQAKAEFHRGQRNLSPRAHRIKDAALVDAIAKGDFPASVGAKIFKGRWGYRPHPQPDIGKEAMAAVMLRQNALLSPMGWFIDQGSDPETVARDMSKWVSIQKKAAEEFGNNVAEVFGGGPGLPISTSITTTKSIDTPDTTGSVQATQNIANAPITK